MKDPSKIKVLVACEESQRVCMAFRERGFTAYSCDIQEPSGGHPEWHILGDAIEAVNGGIVTTMDGQTHEVGKWDLLIAHPPCTYLAVSGNRWFNKEKIWRKGCKTFEIEGGSSGVLHDFCKCGCSQNSGRKSGWVYVNLLSKTRLYDSAIRVWTQSKEKDLSMAQKSTGPVRDRYCKRGSNPA